MQGYTFAETMLTGVSIATTAISEGLPIMITVSLVAGMRRMVQHKAIVKEMSALETLAKVDVICTDKTGTLTKNEMTVKAVIGSGHEWFVTGDGYQPIGEFYEHGEKVNLHQDHPLVWLSTLGVLCNDSEIETPKRNSIQQTGSPSIHGDPTEAALVVTAMKAGLDPGKLRAEWSRIREIPFDSARRCMLVVCKNQAGEYLVCMKGSIDIVMEKCRSMQQGNQVVDFTTRLRTKVIEQERQQAKRAMRVLGIAYKKVIQNPEFMSEEELEADLIWTGMFAMKDPPREHVRDSIAVCQNAGIHVVMITGDHSITATAIGCELGIIRPGERVLTGQEVARMSDEQLQSALNEVKVFSRVSPTDKQRIVKCFQNQGKQVAMLGDGVNDAPSLKQADIGIALGTGTDAAKEAASFILTNNDFGVVVKAIRQGRYVLGNIRSTIGYIFLGNLSEVLYAALTVVAGLPLALMPMQMMFMNMLTDSLPTLLLTIGHPATHRDQPISAPLSSVKEVFDRSFISRVIASGVVVGLSTAALFFGVNAATGNIQLAGTVALAALCLGKLLQIPYWRQSAVDSEKPRMDSLMKLTLGMGIVGLLLAIYLPSLRFLFNSVPLGIGHWVLILATVLVGRILVPLLTSLLDKKLKQQNLPNMSHLSFPKLKFSF
jgi:P-type Ca2+ transporter type 2C